MMIYKIPREPSANRVYVWRKLKQLRAVLLQDAVWVLPESSRTREHFQWLAAEIDELGGAVTLWSADQIYATDDQALRREFEQPVASAYRDILAKLKAKAPDRAALAKQFQQAQAVDYFHHPLGEQARQELLSTSDRGQKNARGSKA